MPIFQSRVYYTMIRIFIVIPLSVPEQRYLSGDVSMVHWLNKAQVTYTRNPANFQNFTHIGTCQGLQLRQYYDWTFQCARGSGFGSRNG